MDHAHRLPFWFTIGDGRAANPWSRRGSVAPSIRGWSDDAARRQKRSPGAEPLDVWMDDDGHGRTAPTSIVLEERDRGDPVARRCRDEHEGEWDCQDGAFHELTSPVRAGRFRPCTDRSKHRRRPWWGSRAGSFRHPNVEPTLVSGWRVARGVRHSTRATTDRSNAVLAGSSDGPCWARTSDLGIEVASDPRRWGWSPPLCPRQAAQEVAAFPQAVWGKHRSGVRVRPCDPR